MLILLDYGMGLRRKTKQWLKTPATCCNQWERPVGKKGGEEKEKENNIPKQIHQNLWVWSLSIDIAAWWFEWAVKIENLVLKVGMLLKIRPLDKWILQYYIFDWVVLWFDLSPKLRCHYCDSTKGGDFKRWSGFKHVGLAFPSAVGEHSKRTHSVPPLPRM